MFVLFIDLYFIEVTDVECYLSDCNYSLYPLNQTRIDSVGLDRMRPAFKLSCILVRGNY